MAAKALNAFSGSYSHLQTKNELITDIFVANTEILFDYEYKDLKSVRQDEFL